MKRPLVVVALLLVAGCGSAAANTPPPTATDAQGRHGVPYINGWTCISDTPVSFDPSGKPPTLCYGKLVYLGPVNITDPSGNVVGISP